MDEKKHTEEPSGYRESQSFKQNYAGTFVAKRIHDQKDSVNTQQEKYDPDKQIMPMEMKISIDKCLAWLSINHNAVTAVSTALIFLATAIYAVFASLQWIEMRKSVETARQTLEAQNRPW